MPQFESKTIQETEIQTPKNEKTEDFGYNPEIKKIGDNLQKNFPNDFDNKIFDFLVKSILSGLEKDYSKEKSEQMFLQSGEKVFEEIMKNDIQEFKNKNFKIFKASIKDSYDVSNIDNTKSNIDNTKSNIDNTKSNIDNTKSNIDNTMNNLKSLYENIPEKFKPSNNKNQWKIFLESNDVNKIKQNTNFQKLDPDKQSKYFEYRFVSTQLSKSSDIIPNKHQFIQSFNQLNKFLDIDVQISIDDRDDKTNEFLKLKPDYLSDIQYNSEKVLENSDIISYVTDSQRIIDKLDIKYTKKILNMLADDDTKEILDYLDDDLVIDITKLNKEYPNLQDQKNIIDTINSKLQELTQKSGEKIGSITDKIVKQKIITNCFQTLASYFDNVTPNLENFSKDFKLDINQDISFDQKKNEISMQGSINGNHVGLHYNMDSGELSMDDFMAYSNQDNGGTYNIGLNHGIRESLKIKLPIYDDLVKSSRSIDFNKSLQLSDNIPDYEKNIKSDLDKNLSKNFSNVNLNKYYIEQFNEKNIAEQYALSDIFYNREKSNGISIIDFNKENKISKDLQPQQFKLIRLLFNSLENYKDPDKLRTFRDCISRFNLIINSDQVKDGKSSEPMINQLFNQISVKASMERWKTNQGEINYFTFFDIISKGNGDDRIINIELFTKILDILEKKEEINDNIRLVGYDWFMDEYRKKYNNPEIEI